MKKDGRVRIFSLGRLVLSLVVGFLFLVSYVVVLFLIDRAGRTPPNIMLAIIGWPRWLWVLLGGQFSDDALAPGLTFFALCNTALYATMTYAALMTLSIVKLKRTVSSLPPPKPEPFDSAATSD